MSRGSKRRRQRRAKYQEDIGMCWGLEIPLTPALQTKWPTLENSLKQVNARLKELEVKHGISTEQMRKEVVTETRVETEEILTWLMLHNRKRHIEARLTQ